MTQLIQVEAYLGPEKPDTIAEVVVQIPDDKDHRDFHYAVVRQDNTTGQCDLLGIHESEKQAMGQLAYSHSNKGFGILCNARTLPVEELAAEALSVS